MRIVVFGASGRTGVHVVEQALGAGHSVTAVVRGKGAVRAGQSAGADWVVADVFDADQLVEVLNGHDAVISVLGVRRPREPTRLCTEATAAIAQAMQKAGIQRIAVVSAAAMTTDGDDWFTAQVVKPLLRKALREQLADMRRMESGLVEGSLAWTVLRPPMLTDGPLTGRERMQPDRNVRRGIRVSRRDLAHALLSALDDDTLVRRVAGVAS